MDVKFVNPGFHYMLDSIMEFQKDDSAYFWNDSLFYFFKDLDKEYAYSLSTEKRREYFEEKLLEIYQENELLLTEKVLAYSKYWDMNRKKITEAFSEAFEIDCSELVVEAVMSDERLSSVNPYYPREQGGCIYPYFFTMIIDGTPITDTILSMYKCMGISDFMRESYSYCVKHEKEIREHILKSENGDV